MPGVEFGPFVGAQLTTGVLDRNQFLRETLSGYPRREYNQHFNQFVAVVVQRMDTALGYIDEVTSTHVHPVLTVIHTGGAREDVEGLRERAVEVRTRPIGPRRNLTPEQPKIAVGRCSGGDNASHTEPLRLLSHRTVDRTNLTTLSQVRHAAPPFTPQRIMQSYGAADLAATHDAGLRAAWDIHTSTAAPGRSGNYLPDMDRGDTHNRQQQAWTVPDSGGP